VQGVNILVPSLDRECIQAAGWRWGDPALAERQKESLRLSILFSFEQALLPAGGYFETAEGNAVVAASRPSSERGQLALNGSGERAEEYVEIKFDQCRDDTYLSKRYRDHGLRLAAAVGSPSWRPKNEPTNARLRLNWDLALADGTHPLLTAWFRAGSSAGRATREIGEIPGRLEGNLMLASHVVPCLPNAVKRCWCRHDTHALRVHLRTGFFDSYLSQAGTAALVDAKVGVHSAAFSPLAPRVSDQMLRHLLGAVGVERQLLQQLSSDSLADLVEGQAWRCLKPELLARASESQPFAPGELKALHRARESRRWKGTGGGRNAVEALLAHQHETLETLATRSVRRTAFGFLGDAAEAMAVGTRPRLWRGEALRASARGADRLPRLLEDVFASATTGEVRQVIEACDLLVRQYDDLRPGLVARMVVEDDGLNGQLRGLPGPVKTALINIGTGTTSSVVGQGLMMALKWLGE